MVAEVRTASGTAVPRHLHRGRQVFLPVRDSSPGMAICLASRGSAEVEFGALGNRWQAPAPCRRTGSVSRGMCVPSVSGGAELQRTLLGMNPDVFARLMPHGHIDRRRPLLPRVSPSAARQIAMPGEWPRAGKSTWRPHRSCLSPHCPRGANFGNIKPDCFSCASQTPKKTEHPADPDHPHSPHRRVSEGPAPVVRASKSNLRATRTPAPARSRRGSTPHRERPRA